MPEASGNILIKASDKIMSELLSSDDSVSWETMSNLFKEAGIKSLKDSHSMLSYHEGEDFSSEGIEEESEFVRIAIFGDEWMHAMQPLIEKGKNIEVYGSISHEHGCTGYYALNEEGKRFFAEIDPESDEDEDADESDVIGDWLACVPAEIRETFPDIFSENAHDSEEDDHEEDEDY